VEDLAMTRTVTLALAALLALAFSACMTSSASKFHAVSDQDVGRLVPGQMASIDAARNDLSRARDEVSLAKLRLSEAQEQGGFTKAEETAAQAERQRAEALTKAAQATGDPKQLGAAQAAMGSADLRQRSAAAHADFTAKLIAARAAEVRAKEARVAEMEARLESAKLTALQQAGNPAANKYDPVRFQKHLAEAMDGSQKAQGELAKATSAAQQSEVKWRALSEQVRVQNQGTASGGQ
jgi:hypothetical protein